MKTFMMLLLLLFTLVLAVPGCSDQSEPLASVPGQPGGAAGTLEATSVVEFSGSMYPTGLTDPGLARTPDGKLMLREMDQTFVTNVAFVGGGDDLISGNGVLELNGKVDFVEGVADFWGNATLTPTSAGALGGVWELTWNGRSTFNGSVWTTRTQWVGHGAGGTLTGKNCIFDNTFTSPPDLSTWIGTVNGLLRGGRNASI